MCSYRVVIYRTEVYCASVATCGAATSVPSTRCARLTQRTTRGMTFIPHSLPRITVADLGGGRRVNQFDVQNFARAFREAAVTPVRGDES